MVKTLCQSNMILFISIFLSGCSETLFIKNLKPSSFTTPIVSNIEIVGDLDNSQLTYTAMGPSLKVKFTDKDGNVLPPPSDLVVEQVGTGVLTPGSFAENTDGTYSLNHLKTDSVAIANKIKISSGTITAESSLFNVTTRSLAFELPASLNNIDPDNIVFDNTHTVQNITELKALVYKRIDTNNDGTIGAGDSFRWIALPPSTKIIFADGDWSDIGKVYLGGQGTSGRPIVFESQTTGGAIFKGSTEIYLYGSYVSMKNMSFTGVKPTVTNAAGVFTMAQVVVAIGRTNTSNAISLDGIVVPVGGTPLRCDYCAFRFNKINNSSLVFNPLQTNPLEDYDDLWTYGHDNEITNNTLTGRNHPGHFIIVWRTNGVEDHHKIRKNEFLDQVYAAGLNGNEAIRIGTGSDTTTSSKSLIEQNLFENIDGEIETVSIKSWDNTLRFNTFRNNKGSLCLRSAGRNLVEGNYFLAMNKGGSGGIRAINEDNLIVGNHIQDTNPGTVADMSKNSGIVIPMGTDNPAANYYYPIVNTKIVFNMFSNNKLTFNLASDAYSVITNDTIDPVNVTIANNVIKGRAGEPYIDRYSPLTSFNFLNNYASNGLLDSARTILDDMTDDILKPFSIQTIAWNNIDKAEDPMNEVIRVTNSGLEANGFQASEISRITMLGATIYEVHAPLERGDVGCGY